VRLLSCRATLLDDMFDPSGHCRYSPIPVICLTRYIPLPSSTLLVLIPITLLGLGLPPCPPIPNCFVGLPANCLVGLKPPPVNCLMRAASDPPSPVNCRANVVAPVYCVIMRDGALPDPNGPPLRVSVWDGVSGAVVRVGDACGELLKPGGRSDRHSRHQTPPSPSPFAALSSLLPHPACLPSSLRPFLFTASLPPHTKQVECHLVPCGPGTTPRSMAETDL